MKRGAYSPRSTAPSTPENYPTRRPPKKPVHHGQGLRPAMGMNDLRDDSERVMRKNFPNSVYYTRGLERKEPWWKLW
jgi:outer membrane protein assembly factor BamD